MRFLNIALLLATIAMSACTTMEDVLPDTGSVSRQLDTGDRIIVYTKAGESVDMHYVLIKDGEIRGSLHEDGLQPVAIDLGEIRAIKVERGVPDENGSRLSNAFDTLHVVAITRGLLSEL